MRTLFVYLCIAGFAASVAAEETVPAKRLMSAPDTRNLADQAMAFVRQEKMDIRVLQANRPLAMGWANRSNERIRSCLMRPPRR
jgi:hypothetical protein